LEKYQESCDVCRGLVQGKAEEPDNPESRGQKPEFRITDVELGQPQMDTDERR
jgi:hypothetical protein